MKHLKKFLEFINNNFNNSIIKLGKKNGKFTKLNKEDGLELGEKICYDEIIISKHLKSSSDSENIYINQVLKKK